MKYIFLLLILSACGQNRQTFRPVDKMEWHLDSPRLSELHGYYADDSGNVEILYHFMKRRDTITMIKPVNKFFDGARYVVVDGRVYQLKKP